MSIPIQYETQDGRMFASILLPNGQRIGTSVDLAPVVGAVCDQVGATDYQRLAAYEMVGGVDIVGAICGEDDYSEVGARRSRRSRRKRRRRKIFGKLKRGLKKVAKPIVKIGKKLAKSKLVKGLAKVVKKIPIYGQLVSAAAKGIKGAVKMGRKIKRRVKGRGGKRLFSGKLAKKAFKRLPGRERKRRADDARAGLRLQQDRPRSSRRPGPGGLRRTGPGSYRMVLSTGREVRVSV